MAASVRSADAPGRHGRPGDAYTDRADRRRSGPLSAQPDDQRDSQARVRRRLRDLLDDRAGQDAGAWLRICRRARAGVRFGRRRCRDDRKTPGSLPGVRACGDRGSLGSVARAVRRRPAIRGAIGGPLRRRNPASSSDARSGETWRSRRLAAPRGLERTDGLSGQHRGRRICRRLRRRWPAPVRRRVRSRPSRPRASSGDFRSSARIFPTRTCRRRSIATRWRSAL